MKRGHAILREVTRITWRPAWAPLRLVDVTTFTEAGATLQAARETWSARGLEDQKGLASTPAIADQVHLANRAPTGSYVARRVTCFARLPDPRGDDHPVIDAVRAEWADSWEHCSQVGPGWLLWKQPLHHRAIQLTRIAGGGGSSPLQKEVARVAEAAL